MASTDSGRRGLAGIALAWFLLFPSLGVVQKYFGTRGAVAYLSVGSLLLIVGALNGVRLHRYLMRIDRRLLPWATAAFFATLGLAFVVLYSLSNSGVASWLSPSGIVGGGSDRDEALNLGVQALLAGRYPYYATTQLGNAISPMPGTLVLAVPFALLGNVAWQNLAWWGVLLAVAYRLFGDVRAALAILALSLLVSPVVLQDFVTGGDLTVNSIIVLVALLVLLDRVPDPTAASWQKIGAALFAGLALSSRSSFLLLVPLVLSALTRRAGFRAALVPVAVMCAAFAAITLPFYWHDPAAFSPLSAQNKFVPFDTALPGSWWLFPGISLGFAVLLSWSRANRMLQMWLIQSGLVLTCPVALLVMLATARSRWPNLAASSYALTGLFFGTLGVALWLLDLPADRPAAVPTGSQILRS